MFPGFTSFPLVPANQAGGLPCSSQISQVHLITSVIGMSSSFLEEIDDQSHHGAGHWVPDDWDDDLHSFSEDTGEAGPSRPKQSQVSLPLCIATAAVDTIWKDCYFSSSQASTS